MHRGNVIRELVNKINVEANHAYIFVIIRLNRKERTVFNVKCHYILFTTYVITYDAVCFDINRESSVCFYLQFYVNHRRFYKVL